MKSSLKQLIAYLVASALVISLFPAYGVASSDNLLSGINYSFEDEISFVGNEFGLSKQDSSCTVTKTAGTAAIPAKDGSNYAAITNRSGTGGGVRVIFAPAPELDKYYIASVWVRLGESSTEAVTGKLSMANVGTNTVQATNEDCPDVTLSTDEWVKLYRIFKVTPKTGATEPYLNRGFHIGFSTSEAGSGLTLHVDNFDVREYTPEALSIMETTPANNATGVATDTVVSVTFNNKIKTFDADDVAVSGGAVLSDFDGDGYTYTFSLGNLVKGVTYEITLSEVTDIFGGTISSYVFSFETEEELFVPDTGNLLNGINYSFEDEISFVGSGFGLSKQDSSCTVTKTAGTAAIQAEDGSNYAAITDRSGTGGGVRVIFAPVTELDKYYIASVWVRLGESSTEAVTGKLSMANPTANTVQPTNEGCPDVTLSTDEWVKLYRIFKVTPKSGVEEPYTNTGFHIGFSTSEAGSGLDLCVDNFDVREYAAPPLEVVETTPSNTATGVGSGSSLQITFSSKLASFAESQITVSGGASVGTISTEDDKTFTVPLTGLGYETTYTVTVSNVTDIFGKTLTSYSFSFTTAESTSSANNLLSGINYSFENPEIEYVTNRYGFDQNDAQAVITRTAGTESIPAQEGDYFAKITNRSGTSAGVRIIYAPAPEVEHTYIASAWVRLAEAPAETVTANFSMQSASSNEVQAALLENPTVELSADRWTKVYRIFKVILKEDATEPYLNMGFHVGVSTNEAGAGVDLLIDNFEMLAYNAEPLAVTQITPENNAVDIDKDAAVSITFNNRLAALVASQISITGGATVDTIDTDGNTQTIKFKRMRNNCTYTVTFSNLEDIYGSSLASYSVSFTTGARVPLENLIVNPGFEENETAGWSFSNNLGHWEAVTEEAHSGLYSVRSCENGEGVSCQLYQRVPVEKNTQYVYSFYAKIGGTCSFALREGSQSGSPVIEGTLITLSPSAQWKRYTVVFNSGENTVIQLWHRHNSSAANYYDDFVFSKHVNEMGIEYSSVADGEINVPVNIGSILLDMTYKIDSSELSAVAGKFSIDNGAEISSVDVSADGYTVVLNLDGNLKNNTTYTLKYDKITDEYGVESEKGSITFTTKPEFMVISETVLSGSTATAVVENCSPETVDEIPVLIAAVYNADKTLSYIKTSPFAGSINPFEQHTLTVNDISLAAGQTYKLYLITSSVDMTLLTPSVGEGADFPTQTGTITSVNPQENVLEIAGKAGAFQEVLIIVLKTADDVSAYNSYIANKVSPGVALAETNIGTYVYNIASAVANENGEYSVVVPMQVEGVERIYGILCENDNINGEAEAVYMPSESVYNAAKSALTSVTGETLGTYMDTYAKAYGISLSSPTYSARTDKILKALYSLYPQGGYVDFTSFGASKSFKKDFNSVLTYYERQDEALQKINTATNLSLTGILSDYSDVLGDYEASSKLDFTSKYNQYGEVNINRQLVGIIYESMDSFIEKFSGTTYTSGNESSLLTPDNNSSGSRGLGSLGGLGYVPESILTTGDKFSDIADVLWAVDSINKLADLGIISGFENGEFRPHNNVTREQFLKMLMLSLDLSAESGANSGKFSDVNENEWYAPYVMAAYNLGVVNGLSDSAFGIGQYISRQDMAVMIYRAVQLSGVELVKVRDMNFDDESSISSYAMQAVKELANAGIINGMSETTFEHCSNTTRAQSAVVLDRIIALKGEN